MVGAGSHQQPSGAGDTEAARTSRSGAHRQSSGADNKNGADNGSDADGVTAAGDGSDAGSVRNGSAAPLRVLIYFGHRARARLTAKALRHLRRAYRTERLEITIAMPAATTDSRTTTESPADNSPPTAADSRPAATTDSRTVSETDSATTDGLRPPKIPDAGASATDTSATAASPTDARWTYRSVHAPMSLDRHIARSDIVIASFGLTALAAMTMGKQVLLFDPRRYHAQCSRALQAEQGRAVYRPRPFDAPFFDTLFDEIAHSHPTRCPLCHSDRYRIHTRFPLRSFARCQRCAMQFMIFHGRQPSTYSRSYFETEYRKQYGKSYIDDFAHIYRIGRERLGIISGLLRPKVARRGAVGHRAARHGTEQDSVAGHRAAEHGTERRGETEHGEAERGETEHNEAERGETERGEIRSGETEHGEAGAARQSITKQSAARHRAARQYRMRRRFHRGARRC